METTNGEELFVPQTIVQLFHSKVSRGYYGSHGGWSTTVLSKEIGEAHAINQNGETIRLICHVDGCGAGFTFRLTPDTERRQFFGLTFKHQLIMFGVALTIAVLGTLIERVSHGIIPLEVLGFALISLGDLASFVLLVALLLSRGRVSRYDLTHEDYGALRAGIQHGVELS